MDRRDRNQGILAAAPVEQGAGDRYGQYGTGVHDRALTRGEIQQRIQEFDAERERLDFGPTRTQRLSPFTVYSLILNRTIATGIFTQPVNILYGAGSSGGALIIWFFAGVIVLCIMLSWLELGLTIPLHYILADDVNSDWIRVSAPRSGGDKNYLEYIFKRPRLMMTCVFGISFIVFGNLAGNALQFGVFMMTVIDPTCDNPDRCMNKGHVVAWAVFVLTAAALLNVATRRLSIGLNNLMAMGKISVLVIMTVLGIVWGTRNNGGSCRKISMENQGQAGHFGDIVLAIFYAMYPYTGFEQPFYVLAEVARPHQTFAKSTISAMLTVLVVYPLVNVSFLCMTPYEGRPGPNGAWIIANDALPANMATAFFARLDGAAPGADVTNTGVLRGGSALLAFFVFGNILAQTFTASRVKQEIAKEGILPWSLVFAEGNTTLFARWFSSSPPSASSSRRSNKGNKIVDPSGSQAAASTAALVADEIDSHLEQAPFAATVLHWAFATLLVVSVGLGMESTRMAYNLLTYLKTYLIIGIMGLLTVSGLLYLKVDAWIRGASGRNWYDKVQWTPWLDPLPTVIATVSLLFLLFAAFVPPTADQGNTVPSWIGPTVGWCLVGLGLSWWFILWFVQWRGRYILEPQRLPHLEIDKDGNAVQTVEIIKLERVPVVNSRARRRNNMAAGAPFA